MGCPGPVGGTLGTTHKGIRTLWRVIKILDGLVIKILEASLQCTILFGFNKRYQVQFHWYTLMGVFNNVCKSHHSYCSEKRKTVLWKIERIHKRELWKWNYQRDQEVAAMSCRAQTTSPLCQNLVQWPGDKYYCLMQNSRTEKTENSTPWTVNAMILVCSGIYKIIRHVSLLTCSLNAVFPRQHSMGQIFRL